MPQMPDLTPATIVALAQAVLGVALSFGLNLDESQQTSLLILVGSIAVMLLGHDAAVRRSRAKHVVGPMLDKAAADAIKAAVQPLTPGPTDPIHAATDRLKAEAELEHAAQASNLAAGTPTAPPGVDPATQPPS